MARSPAPAALIALFALAAAPGVARAQGTRFPAPRFRVEAGAALPINAYVDDRNGAEVTGGVAPFLGAVAAFAVGRNTSVDVGGRFSRGPVSVEASGTSLDADPVVQVAAAADPAQSGTEPARATWPHTVVRLWLLVPQLLPTNDR